MVAEIRPFLGPGNPDEISAGFHPRGGRPFATNWLLQQLGQGELRHSLQLLL